MPPIIKTRSRHLTLVVLTLSLAQTAVVQVRSTTPAPEDPQVLLSRGIDAATTGNYKKAIEYFETAIQVNPQFAPAYYYRGTIRDRIPWIKARPKPVEDFETAIRLNPQYAEAYVELGRARDQISDFDRAIQLNPNLTRAYYWRGYVREKLATGSDQANLIRTAIADYEKALSLNRRYAEAYLAKGRAHRKLKEYRVAVDDLTRAIQFLPKQAEAYEERGLARLESGDENGALEDFVQIIRLAKTAMAITPTPTPTALVKHAGRYTSHLDKLKPSPALAKAYFEEGLAYRYVAGRLIPALASFTRAIELNLNTAAVYYQRSLLYLDQGKRNEAIADLTRAIQLLPTDSDYYYTRGRAYFDAKDFQKASSDFSESIRLSSKRPDVLYWRGRALYHVGDKAKAIADFSTAITANPQAAVIYYWRGRAFEDLGETRRAANDYLKVTEICPLKDDEERIDSGRAFAQIDYFRGRASLALVNEQRSGDDNDEKPEDEAYLNQAVRDFSRYITASPAAVEAYFWRGRAQKLLRQWERAKADLTQAVRLRPTFLIAYVERGRLSSVAEGKKDLNYVVRMRPEWARAYYERADHLKHSAYNPASGNLQLLLSDLNRAIEIDSGFADAYRLRAALRSGILKDLNGAIEDLTQVLRHDPDDLFANRDRAYLRLEIKDYQGAVEDYSRALELAIGSPDTLALVPLYSGRSRARYEVGDGIGSHNDNQQARDFSISCPTCSLTPNLAKAKKADSVFQKGLSLALRGDTRQAKIELEEAVRLYQAAGRMSDCEKAKYELSKL